MGSVPWVDATQRMTVEPLAPNFWRVIAQYGFMEKPDIPALVKQAKTLVPELDLRDVTYYVGHETILHCPDGTGLPIWREKLYAFMQRNSAQIGEYFRLPPAAVVEIGRQIEI